MVAMCVFFCIFFFKQKTAYEMRISDWSSDVCSSDLGERRVTSVRQVTGTVEGNQVVSNELWRPDASGVAAPAAPPTPELTDKLDRYGFDLEAHAVANGWWR